MTGSDYVDGFGKIITSGFIAFCVFVPLGIWKFIEIVIWVVKHFDISFIG